MHVYLPFDDPDLVSGAQHYRDGVGATTVHIHGTPSASLAEIGEKDTLFIFAHGRESTGSQIAGMVKGRISGTRMATMTATDLAKALEGDKLGKKVGDIRLLVCWAGYVGGKTAWGADGDILKRKTSDTPFAGQLCSALKKRGYFRMIVTGYRGTVSYSGRSYLSQAMITGSDGEYMGPHEQFTRPFNDGGSAHVKMVGDQAHTRLSMDTDSRTVWY